MPLVPYLDYPLHVTNERKLQKHKTYIKHATMSEKINNTKIAKYRKKSDLQGDSLKLWTVTFITIP